MFVAKLIMLLIVSLDFPAQIFFDLSLKNGKSWRHSSKYVFYYLPWNFWILAFYEELNVFLLWRLQHFGNQLLLRNFSPVKLSSKIFIWSTKKFNNKFIKESKNKFNIHIHILFILNNIRYSRNSNGNVIII